MNFFKILITTLLAVLFSLSIFAHDPKGESFTLSGKITSVELTDGGGTITVSSEAGRYGKVFLTYNVTLNPCLLYTSPSPRDATLSRMPSSA